MRFSRNAEIHGENEPTDYKVVSGLTCDRCR
jgi:hypothetical protein